MNKDIFQRVAKDILQLSKQLDILETYSSLRISPYNDYEARITVLTHIVKGRLVVVVNPCACAVECFGTVCGVNVYAKYDDIKILKASCVKLSTCDYLKTLRLTHTGSYVSYYLKPLYSYYVK